MRKILLLAALTFAGLTSVAIAGNGKLVVSNESLWTIHHFYISDTDSREWGPDQLEDDVLETDQSFTLRNVPCGSYDVKVVDEDGDSCILSDVDICGERSTWSITNKSLLNCQANTD